MCEAGIKAPNPRKQLLTDLESLIDTHRREGFCPIVMMDANGDYQAPPNVDRDLATFIATCGLAVPYFDKFGNSPRTYAYGTRRIDYIFMDPVCVPAIRRIGYLGTHQGAHSDHCLAYVDMDERRLFQGVINRPVPHHSREITLTQEDKALKFIGLLEGKYRDHKLHSRTFQLAASFATRGPTPKNITKYHTIYTDLLNFATAAAKKVGRRKFGYMRSAELTIKARILLLHKQMLDCKLRRAQMSEALIQQCADLDIDPTIFHQATTEGLRKEVRRRRKDLWDSQKTCEDLRREWLVSVAKDRARAVGNPNWQHKLK